MGFLDRFKKQKEQEVEKKVSTSVVAEKNVPEKIEEAKPKVKAAKEKTAKTSKKEISETLARVLIRPLVTEKSATQTSFGQYVFEINPKSDRREVAAAVFALYGVKPTSVGILNMRREPVRFGRHRGMQKAWKKAIVRLPKGKTINVHEGV
ncbi:MAG: 50S ribosomal protein L23 [Patescibacteria group bacterium]|jgi:large subunit ribosomal protein L23